MSARDQDDVSARRRSRDILYGIMIFRGAYPVLHDQRGFNFHFNFNFRRYPIMDNSSCPPPDLAAVLQTLARFAPPPPPLRIPSTESPYHDEDYEPPETVARASDHAHLQVPGSVPSSAISPENSIPPSKRIDPATITDWPSGLRSVMRTVASNETSVARIKRVGLNRSIHES